MAFDWKNPDYVAIFAERAEMLAQIRASKDMLEACKLHYKHNPADFINDFGMTADPRNIERGLPAVIPFVLFPRQREWIDFILQNWKDGERGLTEKSRDMGISWLAMALSCTLSLFYDDMVIGVGSRKEELVDKLGEPKCLFWKARMFMQYLPEEFRGGWDVKAHAPHMRIMFPQTNSIIAGEAGDNIGRGDRAAIYLVDEAAFIERPQLIEASLSNTTNCRQDLSSVNGMGNPFAEKRHGGQTRVFTFHWRDDPRKDDEWYEKQLRNTDPVTVASEVDISYLASVEGVVIPSAWAQSAVDAHIKLGITHATGMKRGALDVADQGADKNAFGARHGILLTHMEKWSGEHSDIFKTTQWAFHLADGAQLEGFDFDGDGLGAGVRGDARVINEERAAKGRKALDVRSFRGSAVVMDPERRVKGNDGKDTDRKNKDFYANLKAQAWWALRYRFEATYKAVAQGLPFDPDNIISISSTLKERGKLLIELSQPTYSLNGSGKIVIDKQPDGVASPNLADTVMILFAPRRPPMKISGGLLNRVQRRKRVR